MEEEVSELWPHQQHGLTETTGIIDSGPAGPICLTSPTGMGKTRMLVEFIRWAREREWNVVLYTDRKLLTEQTHGVLKDHGIYHGVRAAEWLPTLGHEVQIASIQTENARVYRRLAYRVISQCDDCPACDPRPSREQRSADTSPA